MRLRCAVIFILHQSIQPHNHKVVEQHLSSDSNDPNRRRSNHWEKNRLNNNTSARANLPGGTEVLNMVDTVRRGAWIRGGAVGGTSRVDTLRSDLRQMFHESFRMFHQNGFANSILFTVLYSGLIQELFVNHRSLLLLTVDSAKLIGIC
jgi:hypothetical protein